jgi:Caspase domain
VQSSTERISVAALCVGISRYAPGTLCDGEGQLVRAAGDAISVASWFREAFGKNGVVECLTDEAATHAKVQGFVQELSPYSLDLFIFYFSGHGRAREGDDGLIVYGASREEARLSPEAVGALLELSKSSRTIAIVDACHSAYVLQKSGFFAQTRSDEARIFLAASDALALESRTVEHSIFTSAFLDAVVRIKGRRTGLIDVEAELFPILSFQTAAGSALLRQREQAVVKGGVVKQPVLLPQRPVSPRRLARQLASRAILRGMLRAAAMTALFAIVAVGVIFETTYHIALNGNGRIELRQGPKALSFVTLGYPIVRAETSFQFSRVRDEPTAREAVTGGNEWGIWGTSRQGHVLTWAARFSDAGSGLLKSYDARSWAIKLGGAATLDDPLSLHVLAQVLNPNRTIPDVVLSREFDKSFPKSAKCAMGMPEDLRAAARSVDDKPIFERPLVSTRLLARAARVSDRLPLDLLEKVADRLVPYGFSSRWGSSQAPEALIALSEAFRTRRMMTNRLVAGNEGRSEIESISRWLGGACAPWAAVILAAIDPVRAKPMDFATETGWSPDLLNGEKRADIDSLVVTLRLMELAALSRSGRLSTDTHPGIADGKQVLAGTMIPASDDTRKTYERLFQSRFLPAISGFETDAVLASYLKQSRSASSSPLTGPDLLAFAIRLFQEGLDDEKSQLAEGFLERAKPALLAAGSGDEQRLHNALTVSRDVASDMLMKKWARSAVMFSPYASNFNDLDVDTAVIAEVSRQREIGPSAWSVLFRYVFENLQRRRSVRALEADKDPGQLDQVLSVQEALILAETGRDMPKMAHAVVAALRMHFFPKGLEAEDPDKLFSRGASNFAERAVWAEIWGDWISRLQAGRAAQERARLQSAWASSGDPIVREALADALWRSVEPRI